MALVQKNGQVKEAFVADMRAEHARMSGLVEEIGLKAN